MPNNTYFTDKDILEDILTSIKSLAALYHNFTIEASNDLIFDISSDLKEEIYDEQRDVFNLMCSKGWYTLEKEPKSKVDRDLQKFIKTKTELDSSALGN